MTAPARGAAPFVAVLAAGLLAACGGAEESSSTSTKASSTSTTSEAEESARSDAESRAAESSDADISEAPDGPAQEELTKKQIVDALPEESDAPRDYVEDPKINPDAESTRETDPESCQAIYLDSPEALKWKKEHLTATDGVRYTQPGDAAGRPGVSIFVATYDEPVPKKFFDEAGETLADCQDFNERNDPEGRWTEKRARNVNAPAIGDQSYAHRVGLAELDMAIDQLWVRSGHNIINIRVLTDNAGHSEETMTELAEGVLEDLEG